MGTLYKNGIPYGGTTSYVVDNLESNATNLPLSANQGRILSEMIGKGGTIRYNSETGCIEIYHNGEWVTWKSAGFKTLDILSLFSSKSDSDFKKTWEGGTGIVSLTRTIDLFSSSATVAYSAGTGVKVETPSVDVSTFSTLNIVASFNNSGSATGENVIQIYFDGLLSHTISSDGTYSYDISEIDDFKIVTSQRNMYSGTKTTRVINITKLEVE